jgi:hypothetical protein
VLDDPKFDEACDIPEMAALLNDRMREFVWLYAHNGQNVRAAALECGYHERNGWFLLKRQDVTDALHAIAKRLMHGGVVLAINVALGILNDPTKTAGEQLNAAKLILDRGGFGPQSNHHVKVEKVMSAEERAAMALGISQKLGIPLEKLVGPNRAPAIEGGVLQVADESEEFDI